MQARTLSICFNILDVVGFAGHMRSSVIDQGELANIYILYIQVQYHLR